MGWDKNENKPAELINFEAQYQKEQLNAFMASMDELARTAAETAQNTSDQRLKSFAEFTRELLVKLTGQVNNIRFENDITVDDRSQSLDACFKMINGAIGDYEGWHAAKYNMFENVPGADVFESARSMVQEIKAEGSRLKEYEIKQKAREKQQRWEAHVNEFYSNHQERTNSTAINEARDKVDELYSFVKSYTDEYTLFKAIPQDSARALRKLVTSIEDYKLALKKINPLVSTESEAGDKFNALRKAQAKGMEMAKQIGECLDMELPFDFNDKILASVKGMNNDGVYKSLNDIIADSNDMTALLENSEKIIGDLDLSGLPAFNPENLGEMNLVWRYDAIDALGSLKYEQKLPESEIKQGEEPLDHAHFTALVQEFENFVNTELPQKEGYKGNFDFDNDMDLLQAQAHLEESRDIQAVDKSKLETGRYFANIASTRADELINLQGDINIYLRNILETQHDLIKAGNQEAGRALGKFGVRFSKFYNAMANDLKIIADTGVRTRLEELNHTDLQKAITSVNYAKDNVKFTKEMAELDKIRAEREAQEALKAQKREEENRLREANEQKLAEEKTLKEEAEKREREELQRQREEISKKAEAEYKLKRAEEERAEAERKKQEAEEARIEKERNEEYKKQEALRQAQNKKKTEIRNKYIDLMNKGKSGLIYADSGEKMKSGFAYEFKHARYILLDALPSNHELSYEIYNALQSISDRLESTILDARFFRDHDDTDPQYMLRKYSTQMQTLTNIRTVLSKLADLVPELSDEYETIGAMKEINKDQKIFADFLGFEKPEGSPKKAVMDAAKALTELYHNAIKDGRTLYEKTSQIEAPGIGKIEAFQNEDFSFDKIFGVVSENVNKQVEPAPAVSEAEQPANDDIQINNVNEPANDTLKNFILDRVSDAIRKDLTPDKFEEIVTSGYITYGSDTSRNNLFTNGENGDIMADINAKIQAGEKIFFNLPDLQYLTVDICELDMSKGEPRLVTPRYEYAKMTQAVNDIAEVINATGETLRDSNEFKEFKQSLNNLKQNGIPKDREGFFDSLNDLCIKAFAYSAAKLDQSMNKRRESRFNEANKFIEVYYAVCRHRKPSEKNMNINVVASKFLKHKLVEDSKSKNPETARHAREILSDNFKLGQGILALADKNSFRSLLTNMDENELREFARKEAGDITKELVREMSRPQVQLNI